MVLNFILKFPQVLLHNYPHKYKFPKMAYLIMMDEYSDDYV